MSFRSFRRRPKAVLSAALVVAAAGVWTRFLPAQPAAPSAAEFAHSFEQKAKPFLDQNCLPCHNENVPTSGVRVDVLDGALGDNRLRLWEIVRNKVHNKSMPPEGGPQPSQEDRDKMVAWINEALDFARSRPTPRNGSVRRLTIAQYRNTLRELLGLEEDLTEGLPADAVSKDGFVNNSETLELSPLLMEAYFEVAEKALDLAIVDPAQKPSIQKFRVELGKGINSEPLPEPLILGANSLLLDNEDYLITEPTPQKSFPFEHYHMRTKYRFIEGYKGNATVRGWRDFDSIYHSVFADMRGSGGYPKGRPYATIPRGLLLRPAIPTDELFGSDGTYGPKANFKISLRELPNHGRFRVTVTAAKLNDGLLLDPGDAAQQQNRPDSIVWRDLKKPSTIQIPKAGVYQVDVYEGTRDEAATPDGSRLSEGLAGQWSFDSGAPGALEGDAKLIDSKFGKALSLDGDGDALSIPQTEGMSVGKGDFTVSAWIRPKQLRAAGIFVFGGYDQMPGWRLSLISNKGIVGIWTTGADDDTNGDVISPPGVIRADAWQHVAAVVRRGRNAETRLYVNGFPVARGKVGTMDLSNPKVDIHLGRVSYAQHFRGEIDEARLYTRALGPEEIQALVLPGKDLALPPPETPQEVTLTLGERPFSGDLEQASFVALRLDKGPLEVTASHTGLVNLDRVILTPLAENHPVAQRLAVFEKRSPRLGVHLGFRRDCGSTFAPVGEVQTVSSDELSQFRFEGAILNYPNPDVEENNVNYLAGIREIAVRSEYTDGRDMPRLLVRSVEFEGPLHETWPPATHSGVFLDSKQDKESPAYAREILHSFATRAYRRPVTAAEEAALMGVFERSRAAGGAFRDSVKDALLVALTAPQFLFLVESSETPAGEALDDYELASKLSYFLWNGPPDQATIKLASSGKLRENLDAEVERMIADDRFARFINQFVPQWLNLEKFDVLEPDREKFPKLTRDARTELRREPIQFVEHLIEKNLPVRNLIQSDFVLANEVVADYYGMGDKTESGFRFVPIQHGGKPELGGVLTEAAILAGLSDGRESNPVKRGAWLARKIISEPPDDPPPNVPALSEDTANLTLRERLFQHRNQPGCMECHQKIDPWGVALEEFNAAGRLKSEPADAHSTLPDGSEVSGIDDLKRYLSEDRIDQVAFSVLKHLQIYANGRSLSYYELNRLKEDVLALKGDEYRMQDMVRHVVHSDLFLKK